MVYRDVVKKKSLNTTSTIKYGVLQLGFDKKKPNVRGRTREVMKGGNKWQNIYAHPNDKLQS